MMSLARNARILRNPEGTSLLQYKSRFRCFAIYDLIVGILYAFMTGGIGLGSISFSQFGGIPNGLVILPGMVAALFLLDAGLMMVLSRRIAEYEQQVGTLVALEKVTNFNIVSNVVTLVVYLFYRILNLLTPSRYGYHGSNAHMFTLLIFAFIFLGKGSKVLVIHAFKKWIQAANQGQGGLLGAMPGYPIQVVVAAPMPALAPVVATAQPSAPQVAPQALRGYTSFTDQQPPGQ